MLSEYNDVHEMSCYCSVSVSLCLCLCVCLCVSVCVSVWYTLTRVLKSMTTNIDDIDCVFVCTWLAVAGCCVCVCCAAVHVGGLSMSVLSGARCCNQFSLRGSTAAALCH